jgi:hypothetical protein
MRRPASRSRFGGLAFDDPDDVEGSHVRHDPPSPRPTQGRESLPPPRHLGPRVACPGARYRRWRREGSSPLVVQSGQCGSRYQIGGLRLAVPRGAPAPPGTGRQRPEPGRGLQHRLLRPAQGRQPGRTRFLSPPSPDRQRDRTSRPGPDPKKLGSWTPDFVITITVATPQGRAAAHACPLPAP